jgi:hypothetical protein
MLFTASHIGLALPPPSFQWTAALTLGLTALVVCLRPGWFTRWRTPRVAALASAVPVIAYFHSVGVL